MEVDLFSLLPDTISVELPDCGFEVEIHYEILPGRCWECFRFGHSVDKFHRTISKQKVKDDAVKIAKQVYRHVPKNNKLEATEITKANKEVALLASKLIVENKNFVRI